jgi:hypothetical protein
LSAANYIILMAATFNVLQQENQPLKSPQTLPKSVLDQGEKCANFEQNPMVDKRVIQANELGFLQP